MTLRWCHGLLRSLLIRATPALAGGACGAELKTPRILNSPTASVIQNVALAAMHVNSHLDETLRQRFTYVVSRTLWHSSDCGRRVEIYEGRRRGAFIFQQERSHAHLYLPRQVHD